MGFLSVADVLASLVTSVVAAVGGILCSPLYDKMKASIDVLNAAPETFAADADRLSQMVNDIQLMRSSDEIDGWLSEAEKIITKVPQVLSNQDSSSSQNDGRQPSCCIFGHGVSRCKLHKQLRALIIQGQSIITRAKLKKEPVNHIHGVPNIEDGSTTERNLRKVMDMLSDDAVWSIGVYGPGGVGKTTLANALNNELEKGSSFTLVRSVPLTKDVDDNQVQKAIAKKLQLQVEEGMDVGEIANQIYNKLQREKFLLILDNVWKCIDLVEIGIPKSPKGSKVMLTTRSKSVCMAMKVKPIKIGCLDGTEAWKLFAEKAGDVVTDPEIRPRAEEVCKECGGLPLALVAVGLAMSGKDNVHQWRSTLNDLRSCNFPDDIESQVYKSLKLSFDSLRSDTKSCFLYCSLYPEGFNIPVSELIWCWLAENIIDEQLSYESAYSKGLDLIESLKNSCLLLEGWDKDFVKLHDVVRDVATRIAELNGTSVIHSGHGISKSPKIAFQQDVENKRWISFVDNKELALPEIKKDFPNVTTLLLSYNEEDSGQLTEGFLEGFQALRVLNVRNLQSFLHLRLHLTYLRALLLRDCGGDLEELPCGTKLMVLDLSYCSFYKLPRGIEKQTSLRELVLWETGNLKTIEVDVILNLSALEVLDMRGSGYKWPTMRKSESKDQIVLEDLSRLKRLKEAYLELADVEATYEGSSWMQRLKYFSFCYNSGVRFSLHEGKRISIEGIEGSKIRSFILHAETVYLSEIVGNVNEIFANFNPNNWSNSKLKELHIVDRSPSKKLTEPIPSFDTLTNLERLFFFGNKQYKSFYQIANALGTTFPKLRTLEIGYDGELENVLPLDYPYVVMPEIEEMNIYKCKKMTKVFHDGPSQTQAVVPKLKRLDLLYLESLQSLCSCGSSEHWQSLEVLRVWRCPNLKKLPRMASIKEIRGREEWWNNLEWDYLETKSYMAQFFKAGGW